MTGTATLGAIGRMAALPLVCLVLPAASGADPARKTRSPQATLSETDGRVTDVRFWSLADATRVAIEVNREFEFRSDRLTNPDRLFFDIVGARPTRIPTGVETIAVRGPFIRQIRVAETMPGITRVVLDLNAEVEHTASQLSNPDRLIVELRASGKPALSPLAPTTTRIFSPPPERRQSNIGSAPVQLPVSNVSLAPPKPSRDVERVAAASTASRAPVPVSSENVNTSSKIALADAAAKVESAGISTRTPDPPVPPAVAAKRNSAGERSLTRVLGLKLGRVVLDPGHGGHDSGTKGAGGLLEKDVVLDVTKRLGALIEERLGSEVVYTRDDDTFVPLEERTRIANRHKADLFLSIHANSSSAGSASGVETYYLNFTTNKAALEVAARENASSERSIYDLRDLVQKIALQDKLDESREFAAKVQSSLTRLSHGNSPSRDRGVRKAPFVVLIGAQMPSVLCEIGFISNPRDEGAMKKSEYRQKIAEALYKGVSQYASGLSRFQVAAERSRTGDE